MSVISTSTRLFSSTANFGDGQAMSGTSRLDQGSAAWLTYITVGEDAVPEGGAEEVVIVEDQAQPGEDQHVGIGLKPSQKPL
jgi:hypothetical protein